MLDQCIVDIHIPRATCDMCDRNNLSYLEDIHIFMLGGREYVICNDCRTKIEQFIDNYKKEN